MSYSGSPGPSSPHLNYPHPYPSTPSAATTSQGRPHALSAALDGGGDDSGGSSGSYAAAYGGDSAAAAALALKSRSAIACVLCRRQKMKCSGGSPCRRCKNSGVECVFESPPVSAPRPRATPSGVSEAWVESRLMSVEDRLATLETSSPPPSSSALARPPLQDHERRIAHLEAQLYALQMSNTGPQQRQISRPPSVPSSLSPAPRVPQPQAVTNPYNFPTHLQPHPSTAYLASCSPDSSPYPAQPPRPDQQHAPYPKYPPSGRHTFPAPARFGNGNGIAGEGEQEARGEKRWKGEDGSVDFITRGEVTEEEARLCFESYFLNYSFLNPTAAPNLSRPIHLPFDETRAASSLLLSTVIFLGARSLSRVEIASLALAEALRLCHYTFLPETPPSSVDYKALTLLSLYTGMEDLQAHAIAMSFDLGLPSALLEFDKLSEEAKKTKAGSLLVVRGRAFLIGYLWTAYYSVCRGKHGGYPLPKEVMRHQLDVLEQSMYTQQPTDRLLRVQIEACLIIRGAFDQLGPGMRMENAGNDDICAVVSETIVELQNWSRKWLDMMEMVSTWGDTAELKTAAPFHHNRLCILMYIFRPVTPENAHTFPGLRDFAAMARESALMILRFGVESQIWLPHSMTGQYLVHCNIPTCLLILNKACRLFPQDASFPTIRPLLHRVLTQSDEFIQASIGTCRELTRARLTKNSVLELDRFAFEVGGERDQAPAREDAYGQNVSASLSAMGGELNLWGCILLDLLEDVPPTPPHGSEWGVGY